MNYLLYSNPNPNPNKTHLDQVASLGPPPPPFSKSPNVTNPKVA
jgi:hypothetical protein